MNCLFCHQPSGGSFSEEHVIPVALGNKRLVLPPGLVCDACNHYFAIKVEKPLLEYGRFRDLRARQELRSRRGNLLPRQGTIHGSGIETSFLIVGDRIVFWPDQEEDAGPLWRAVDGVEAVLVPAENPAVNAVLLSRLLAKAGLEHLALKTHAIPGWESYAWGTAFNGLRRWARSGLGPVWPVHERRLYEENTAFVRGDGDLRQTIWEAECWQIDDGCHYWVVCIFGVEYAINFRVPEIENYARWLRVHGGLSPLYVHPQLFCSQGIARGFEGRGPC
jgi:hypothetical protein